jgi:hypothetical protein
MGLGTFWNVLNTWEGRWEALHEEMRIDMHRIWKRNLGRDDYNDDTVHVVKFYLMHSFRVWKPVLKILQSDAIWV